MSLYQKISDHRQYLIFFFSKNALASDFVKQEAELAVKLASLNEDRRILVFCLDDTSVKDAFDCLKPFNFVRNVRSHQSITRKIVSRIIEAQIALGIRNDIFVGRDENSRIIQLRLIDPEAAACKGLYFCGLDGIGRRSLARSIFSEVYKHVGFPLPQISIDQNDEINEFFRKLYSVNTPLARLSDIKKDFTAFSNLARSKQLNKISMIIKDILSQKEAITIFDRGGLLEEDGTIRVFIRDLIDRIPGSNHPPFLFISSRMPPDSEQRIFPSVVFHRVPSLSHEDTKILFGHLVKEAKISITRDQLEQLVELSDGHPINVIYCVENIRKFGIHAFLNNPEELVLLKRNRAKEFLSQFEFSQIEIDIISCLAVIPSVDGESLFDSIDFENKEIAIAISNLVSKNIIQFSDGDYQVLKPLLPAVQHDKSFKENESVKKFLRHIADRMTRASLDDELPVSTVEPSIRAALASDTNLPDYFSAIVLPSHRVWQAQRLYDQRKYREALTAAKAALSNYSALSRKGMFEAFSFAVRAASRIGDHTSASKILSEMNQRTSTSREKANYHFLKGFYERSSARFKEAEEDLKIALRLNPNHANGQRELAHLLYVQDRYDEALPLAQSAHEHIPNNPFILDTYVAILLSLLRKSRDRDLQVLAASKIDLLDSISSESETFGNIRRGELALIDGESEIAHNSAIEGFRNNPSNLPTVLFLARTSLERRIVHDLESAVRAMDQLSKDVEFGEVKTNVRAIIEYKSYLLALQDNLRDSLNIIDRSSYHDETEKKYISDKSRAYSVGPKTH